MDETSKNQRKKSLLGQLSDLAVGEELTVPVSRSRSLNHSNKDFITLTLQ